MFGIEDYELSLSDLCCVSRETFKRSVNEKMKNDERLKRQIRFCLEIDKEKEITRQTYLSSNRRKENDAEHAWHMAVMAMILFEYSNKKIDKLKTIYMLLIHDLVEVYAGDTFAYNEEAVRDQKEKEQKAADKLFSLLPEDQSEEMRKIWYEFEQWESPEACFAHTLDNFQPMLLNNATCGRAWREHGVKVSQVLKRNSRTDEGSMSLWNFAFEHFVKPNVDLGNLIDDLQLDSN